MNYIFIDTSENVDKIGVVENNHLVEFHIEEKDDEKLLGDIYRGRVVNVLKGMSSAFVDIGGEKNAYLYVKDALPKEFLYDKKHHPINEVVKAGEEVIVQVRKEAAGTKGAKVSTHIEIPGRYIVLTPYSNKLNISRKIRNKESRKKLKATGKDMMKDGVGVIFRTVSENIDEDIIKEEYNILLNIYRKIQRERNFLPCPKLIYKEPDLGYQIIRDVYNEKIDKIIVNNKDSYKDLILMEEYFPFKFSHKIELNKDFSVDFEVNIQKDIKKALSREVYLKSGGYIVIDQLEALTIIDVNTGGFIGTKSLGDTVFKTNIEATKEIARQIRLRDLAGIIIIDFIDMRNRKHKKQLLHALKKELAKARNRANIVGITKLGLVELTRKKTRRTLGANFYIQCPHCKGSGKIIMG
ncbi:MAG TPA: Rne/Rng family ribonuclease [Tissierellaceae bacterium]|nr:Rne/Rng family ribonuclease [Tissierellaceae bacterium]